MSGAHSSVGEQARLTALLLDLLAMPCTTGEEGPIADWLERRYAPLRERVTRVDQSLVVGEADERPRVLLVGHLDVVPPTDDDREPRLEGDMVVGRGASDMKAGLAVAMDCFEDPALRSGPYCLQLVAYAGEEGSHAGNELGPLIEAVPALRTADLAVVLEPTDLTVQLGCLGTLHAEVVFRGRAAHSARPWHGENALTKAGSFLDALRRRPPRDVDLDGLVYREVVSATDAWVGEAGWAEPRLPHARNVLPAACTVNVNVRFAPDRSVDVAEALVRELAAEAAQVRITDRAPAAPPLRDAPLVRAFVAAAAADVQPKQAWTDVARFAEVGVPALNYGPGLTAQAHQRGEHVPLANLAAARHAVGRFLAVDPVGEAG